MRQSRRVVIAAAGVMLAVALVWQNVLDRAAATPEGELGTASPAAEGVRGADGVMENTQRHLEAAPLWASSSSGERSVARDVHRLTSADPTIGDDAVGLRSATAMPLPTVPRIARPLSPRVPGVNAVRPVPLEAPTEVAWVAPATASAAARVPRVNAVATPRPLAPIVARPAQNGARPAAGESARSSAADALETLVEMFAHSSSAGPPRPETSAH